MLEHLHDVNRCRALFATHYHELTALAAKLPGLRNATVAVREWQGEVIFLHEVQDGAADRSYGVQVARLAGLPAAVVERARVVLDALERGERERGGKAKALVDDLPLFAAAARPAPAPAPASAVEARLRAILPDELSPRDALALVYELRALTEVNESAHGSDSRCMRCAPSLCTALLHRRIAVQTHSHRRSSCVDSSSRHSANALGTHPALHRALRRRIRRRGALRDRSARDPRRAAARRVRDDPRLRRRGRRQADIRAVVAAPSWLGSVLGDNAAYLIGRKLGRPVILRYGSRVGLTEGAYAKAEAVAQPATAR